jgi:uncharacterized protein (DUF433 family)
MPSIRRRELPLINSLPLWKGRRSLAYCSLVGRFCTNVGRGSRGATMKSMAEAPTAEPVPLETGSDGVLRVRGTRVTMDTVWPAFTEGVTAEEIVQQYPSLSLADAYQVIGFCLRHSSELDSYLELRSCGSQETRQLNESKWRPEGIRARLLARRQQ